MPSTGPYSSSNMGGDRNERDNNGTSNRNNNSNRGGPGVTGGSGGDNAGAGTGGGSGASASKAARRSSGKAGHSRSYPRGVGLDFRKLAGLTLLSYIDHHGVPVRSEAPPSELAVAVARNFEQMEVDEDDCIGGFLERLEKGSGVSLGGYSGFGGGAGCASSSSATAASGSNAASSGAGLAAGGGGSAGGSNGSSNNTKGSTNTTEYARKSSYFNGLAPLQAVRKNRRNKWAARPGEQVAAKVTRTDENGSWILASVQRFYSDTETYDVQDEDDTSKLIRLPWSHVMRLSTGVEGCFNKGADCMAIFPETTSFYRAKISKSPVWKLDRSNVPMVKEIIVKFEDDEDSNGRTPHRRVPSRYVIPIPSQYFYDEADDIDLTPPSLKTT